MSSVNAYNNQQQKEEEVQQKEVMKEDLQKERLYFEIQVSCSSQKAVRAFEENLTFKAIREKTWEGRRVRDW